MRLNRAESSSSSPPVLQGIRGQGPSPDLVLGALVSPGFAPRSLLLSPPAQFLLGAGATRGCDTQGSQCMRMRCQCRVLCGTEFLPVLPWLGGLAGVPVPCYVRGRTHSQISTGLRTVGCQWPQKPPAVPPSIKLFSAVSWDAWRAEIWPFWGEQTP